VVRFRVETQTKCHVWLVREFAEMNGPVSLIAHGPRSLSHPNHILNNPHSQCSILLPAPLEVLSLVSRITKDTFPCQEQPTALSQPFVRSGWEVG
jgi:hypothetical protein